MAAGCRVGDAEFRRRHSRHGRRHPEGQLGLSVRGHHRLLPRSTRRRPRAGLGYRAGLARRQLRLRPTGQARRCFEIVAGALAEAGASLDDVVRSRVLLVDMADIDAVSAVHAAAYARARPAATMVAVAGLVDPRWKLEIEAEAVIASSLDRVEMTSGRRRAR